jgi:hypothetical protein
MFHGLESRKCVFHNFFYHISIENQCDGDGACSHNPAQTDIEISKYSSQLCWSVAADVGPCQ